MADSFNYISFGNRERVDGVGDVEMSRGRMFEYTPTELAKGLEDLGQPSLDFLGKLPTFLCSEIDRSTDNPTMIVRFGRVSNLEAGKREVTANFEPIIDFGEVAFESIDQATEIFGADGFQLYRTHWAVREGASAPILEALAERKPATADEVTQFLGGEADAPDAQPPERHKNIIGEVDSVETFLGVLQAHPPKDGDETFYRGHEDVTFELTPSLLRKWSNGSWKFMPNEDRLCKELLIAHYDEFEGDQYCFDQLVRMQHYGLPTRLLDISGNPLVALFFACYCKPELMDEDGEVIIFRVPEEQVKYYDSDTVSCISNLSKLSYEQKSDIDLSLELEEFNEEPVTGKLLHHIKSEKGYFEARIVPDDLGSIVCVKAKQTNTRIKSQSGAFLLFGHEAILPESGQDGLEVSRITVKDKQRILDQLDALNINATTVYPSIQETAQHVKARYSLPDS
jgi:hypothetical protein